MLINSDNKIDTHLVYVLHWPDNRACLELTVPDRVTLVPQKTVLGIEHRSIPNFPTNCCCCTLLLIVAQQTSVVAPQIRISDGDVLQPEHRPQLL